jgi:outer membrane lipoprotein-sorting protein
MNTFRRIVVLAVAALLGSAAGRIDARADDAGTAGDAGAAREPLVGPRLDALLADIARARRDVRTLRASFTQERRMTLLHTSVKSHGELLFAAPGRLRWDLAPPDDVTYFVGPEGMAYKTKTSSAAVPAAGTNIGKALSDLRALLAGDLVPLRERYELSASRNATDVEITGEAKDPKASVRSFTIALEPGLVVVTRTRLVESKTDSIDLTFANVVVNGPVDPALLRP